ncbi:MAG TPA: hypothetical protein PL125_05420 [Candidatus Omnitrophota bacterium]|nr:hypothetical protein [Candidatus Omnitrophota bacterium]HPT39614.1 hypothetical protein [Candidatus Omnitrophota bacterium]
MKKLVTVFLVLGFLVINSNTSFAEWFAKGETEKTAAAVAAPVVSKKQAAKTQDMIAKRKVSLNGTQWEIEIKAMSGKAKADKDLISFADGKVNSRNMEAKGFEATNFSMRLLEDGETYTWETMQVSEKTGAAFWRGDIGSDGIMRGVLSIRDKKNKVSDFNFYSLTSNKIVAESAPAPVVQAAEPAPAPVVAQAESVSEGAAVSQ